jgi:hypothetical protein
MIMNFKKIILVAALSLVPMLAVADLTIVNNTDKDGTAKIGSMCSYDLLMMSGILYKHSTYTGISSEMIDEEHMCKDLVPCIAYLYPNTKCKGNPIAGVELVGGRVVNTYNYDLAEYNVISDKDESGNDLVTINPASAGWAS